MPLLDGPATGLALPNTTTAASLLRRFASPLASQRPRMRWWVPSADLDLGVVSAQLDSLASVGVGGAELADLGDGFGSAAWRNDVLTALKAAHADNLALDLTVGPRWPAAVPTIDLNSDKSAQGIYWGAVSVQAGATYDDVVPVSVDAPAAGVTAQTLVAVVATRVAAGSSTTDSPILLDRDTAVVLTDQVSDGKISWTAPVGDGSWQLMSFWQRSEGKTVNGWPVVNHFDRSGTDAVIDYWEDEILTPTIRNYLSRGTTNLFEDSLELTQCTHWTTDLVDVFKSRRGYDPTEHLPVLMVRFTAIFDIAKVYAYADGSDQGLRNDYYEILSALYNERHLAALRDWAHGLGMGYRCQVAYGATMDMQYAALVPDIPETESLWFAEKVDAYRSMSAAAHVPGKNVFSVETDVVVPPNVGDDGYAISFPGVLNLLHGNFAGYINQIMFHGYPYPIDDSSAWPGYSPFASIGGGIGESWGPRNPNWHHMRDLTDYLGRLQTILQQGQAEVDVAIYRHAYWDRGRDNWDPAGSLLWNDPGLRSAGYSYEYVDPHLLDLPQSVVRGRRLAPSGAAYKALVLTDVAEPHQSPALPAASNTMTLAKARQILAYARDGLPIVIVGDLPASTPFESDASDSAAVAAILEQVASRSTTRRVATEAMVPEALRSLGVVPDAQFRTPVDHVWTVGRRHETAKLYYLYNEGAESTTGGYQSQAVTLKLSLEGDGIPYRLDAWTGHATPIATYTFSGGRVRVTLPLAPHEAAVIAVAPKGWGGVATPHDHVTSTTADQIVVRGGRLFLRASTPGTYVTHLARSGKVTTRIDAVPAVRHVRDWSLSVKSYEPGATADTTSHRTIKVTLRNGLQPWADVPALEGVSGIGDYSSSFELPARWDRATSGVLIHLGEIANSARVWINGKRLGAVDLITGTVEARSQLRGGRNTIRVEVTTTLSNELRTLAGGSGRAVVTDGLLGVAGAGGAAVVIAPFREEEVHATSDRRR